MINVASKLSRMADILVVSTAGHAGCNVGPRTAQMCLLASTRLWLCQQAYALLL
jgi:hypothetical protein